MFDNNDSNYIEAFNLNANYVTVYKKYVEVNQNSLETFSSNFKDNFHDCMMSKSAVKIIKKAVNVILYLTKRRYRAERKKMACTGYAKNDLTGKAREASNWQGKKEKKKSNHLCTFVTLTLPAKQEHTDIEITKYLVNPFLAYARKYFGVRYYIWKKELQQNGNLHFHFVIDRYIDHMYLRSTWNRLCNRGTVAGVNKPFEYVTQYHLNMVQFYGKSFDMSKMKKFFEQSQYTIDAVNEKDKEFFEKTGRNFTSLEYDQVFNKVVSNKLLACYQNWQQETNNGQKAPSECWNNPNSTDISAVSNPRMISAYIAKYLSKDIDENPVIDKYIKEVTPIKENLLASVIDKARHAFNNEPTEDDDKNIDFWKKALAAKRLECPIQGKLWFKSLSLTPFIKGAKAEIDNVKIEEYEEAGETKYRFSEVVNYSEELSKLREYLKALGAKRGRDLVIIQYQPDLDDDGKQRLNPDGSPKYTDNVISTTLLVNAADLDRIGCKKLSILWRKFIYAGLDYNRRRGLYERPDNNYMNNYEAA